MPKISEARRAERRAEVLDAALRCFDRAGYQRTSMADIIAESGLSAGAIYGYFDSKQDIIRAVVTDILNSGVGQLQVANDDRILSPAEIVQQLVEGIGTRAPLAALIQAWAEATVDEELRGRLQGVISQILAVLSVSLGRWAQANPEQVAGDPQQWAASSAPVLMSMVPGYMLQAALVDGFDAEAYLAAIPQLLIGGDGDGSRTAAAPDEQAHQTS